MDEITCIILTIVAGAIGLAVFIFIGNLIDTSPTDDPNSRGGHDF